MVSAIINIINIFILRDSIYFKYIFIIPFIALLFQLIIFFSNYGFLDLQYGGYNFTINLFDKVYEVYFNSNGFGRTTTLIYTISVFYFFEAKKFYNKGIYYLISFVLAFIVISLSGRFNTLGLMIINIIIFIYYKKIIIKNWIYLIFTIFLLYLSVTYYKDLQKNFITEH